MNRSIPIPERKCAHCGYLLTGAEAINGPAAAPSPGDWSICIECGEISVFTEEGFRKPTPDEQIAVDRHEEIRRWRGGIEELRRQRAKAPGRLWLRHMVETVRSGQRPGISTDARGDEEYGQCTKQEVDGFFRAVESCHPFVFEHAIPDDYEGWTRGLQERIDRGELGTRVCPGLEGAPFPVFSIECLDGPLYVVKKSPGEKYHLPVFCVVVAETGPLEFEFYMLVGSEPHGKFFVAKSVVAERMAEIYVDSLRASQVGLEACRERVKLGSGNDRRTHEIRRIIRVCSKRAASAANPLFARTIDWTHRWVVRGHWRRVAGVGKNREGEYVQRGFTWVKDFEKGPAEAPLVANKVRVVPGAKKGIA